MSQTTKRLPLERARQVAQNLLADLWPGCARAEIAGSVRRRRPDIGDLEIVVIPICQADLLGAAGQSMLDDRLRVLEKNGLLRRLKWGPKYKQFELPHAAPVKLDLNICTIETWGVRFLLSTGPADWNQRIVTPKDKGGLCPNYLRFKDNRIWKDARCHRGEILDTPEEKDVFKVLGLTYREPWER
jgi:DNA polymerase/3'-5' exonuclease PolX